MTATDAGPDARSRADIAADLRAIDRRLDALAELVGTPEVELGRGSIERELRSLDDEVRALDARLGTDDVDDPLGSTRMAVAVRRERLGFVRAALLGGDLTAPEPQAVPESTVAARAGEEGQRATSVGRTLSVIGLVLVGFLIFELTISALLQDRSQQLLLQQFRERAPLQAVDPAAAAAAAEGQTDGVLTAGEAAGDPTAALEEEEPEIIPAAEPPAVGEPIGILQIPSLSVEQVVVQGSGQDQLRAGPGHLRGTPMPGEPGNAVIAGPRVSYGAPFKRLQQLDVGDRIDMTTAVGRFRYEVRSVERIGEGDPDPVRATGGTSTLTLLTSTPRFVAYDQLAVVADLVGQPVKPRFKPVSAEVGSDGFDTGGGLAPLVVWGALFALAVFAARQIFRRWPLAVAYLVCTPVLLALLILLFESLGGILPATF